MKAQETYCLQLLRRRAYAVYFSLLFAPAAKRGALAGLYAFQAEILQISKQVREPLLGEMRLQWWRDNLIEAVNKKAQAAGKNAEKSEEQKAAAAAAAPVTAAASPVIAAAAAAIAQYNLPLAAFLRLCDAARFDLYQDIMPNCAAWENYCQALYGSVLQLACQILGADSPLADKACQSGAVAQGLAALIEHLPWAMRHGKLYIPADILANLGINKDSLPKAAGPEPIKAGDLAKALYNQAEKRETALAALIAYFHEHYKAFTRGQKALPACLRPAFLPLAALPVFIRRAEKQREAVFTASPLITPLRRQAAISRAALFNRF